MGQLRTAQFDHQPTPSFPTREISRLTMEATSSRNDSFIYDSNTSLTNSTNGVMGDPLLSPQAFRLLTDIFFSFIIVTGVVGNSLVTAVILRWKEIRTPCNIFLLNIAIADFLITGIAGSLRIIEVHSGWILGDFLCRFLAPLQDVFVGVSAISHSTISWERYQATVTPFKPRISKVKAKCMLPAIWLFSYVTCGLPLVFATKLREVRGKEYCLAHWSAQHRRVFEIFLVLMYIILQLGLQTFAYLNIIRALKSKEELLNESLQGNSTNKLRNSSTNSTKEKKKSKTIKMLIVLVVVFQIGYIPRGTVMLIAEFSHNLSEEFLYIELVSLVLYYLKHVLNPLILFLMSADFKSALKSFLACWTKTNNKKANEKVELRTTIAPARN